MFFIKGFFDFLTIFFRKAKFFAILCVVLFSVGITMAVYSSHVVEHIPVYVTDLDNSNVSRTIRGFLLSSPDLSVQGVIDNYDEAREALENGDVAAVILIPQGLSQAIKTQQGARVQVIIEGTNIIEARNVDRAVQTIVKMTSVGVSMTMLSKQGVPKKQLLPLLQPINLDVEKPFNPLTLYTDYLMPVLIFFNLWLFICLMVNAAFQEDPGTTITSHKIRKRFFYLGRMTAIAIIAALLGVIVYMKGLPRVDIILMSTPFMAITSLAAFIIISEAFFTMINLVLTKARLMAMTVSCLCCMMGLMISGLTWPLEMLPWYVREFSTWMPLTPFLSSVQVFLYHDATWADLSTYYSMFLKQAIVYFAAFFVVMRFKDVYLLCRYIYHRVTKKEATESLLLSYPQLAKLNESEDNKTDQTTQSTQTLAAASTLAASAPVPAETSGQTSPAQSDQTTQSTQSLAAASTLAASAPVPPAPANIVVSSEKEKTSPELQAADDTQCVSDTANEQLPKENEP